MRRLQTLPADRIKEKTTFIRRSGVPRARFVETHRVEIPRRGKLAYFS
jgi:hypothetical protein